MAACRESSPGAALLVLSLLLSPGPVLGLLDPISLSVGAASVAALYAFYPRFYCGTLVECCQADKEFNITALYINLNSKIFGQHLATDVVFRALSSFMTSEDPKKPLVLSLHGWTGTGKNFISNVIAESIYDLGVKSKFVHLFVSTMHFPHDRLLPLYKDQLQSWIKGNVSSCPRSVFIFDEMDKLQPGLIDAIKPFLDYYVEMDGVSYRKAVFIFLSNAGGDLINREVLKYLISGKTREELQLSQLEPLISVGLYNNDNSGFWHSSLIAKNLIDFYIPFLPLEFRHVKKCVLAELRHRNYEENEELASRVAKEMVYFPKESKFFSDKGCKTVSAKLDLHL